MPRGSWAYSLRRMLAARVYHQSGFWGCFSTWLPVFATCAHVGGWIWSVFSLRYLAKRSMNCCAGTSWGVVKFFGFLFQISLQLIREAKYKGFHLTAALSCSCLSIASVFIL